MLKQIFEENWVRIVLSYTVLVTENVVFALCPWLFGRAVDGLMKDDMGSFRLYMALVASGVIVGSARRLIDTRVFGKIWEKFSTGIILDMMEKGKDKNKIMVCAGMSPKYVDFLEWHLPNGARGVIFGVVALVMLFLAVPGPGVWMVLVAIGVMISSDFVAKKQAQHEGHKIDSMEESTRAINDSDREMLLASYEKRIHHYIKRSDWEAAGWCVSDALSIAAEAMIVLALVREGATVGLILSTTVYVGQMFASMNTVAFFISSLRSLQITGEKIEAAQE